MQSVKAESLFKDSVSQGLLLVTVLASHRDLPSVAFWILGTTVEFTRLAPLFVATLQQAADNVRKHAKSKECKPFVQLDEMQY